MAAVSCALLFQPRLGLSFLPALSLPNRISVYRLSLSLCSQKNPSPAATAQEKSFGRSGGLSSSPVNENQTVIDVNPPRGTRDFPPEDMRLRNWLFQNFREVSRLFAFEEVDFPVLESEALYTRKAGEEITDQLYGFEDKGGRRVALRPELTPSLARLVIQKGQSLPLPIKWFAIGQCWRYERTTRGRRREHYQWNMDIIGVSEVTVLQAVLQHYSIPEELFGEVCVIIDKMEKVPMEEVEKKLISSGISVEAINGLLQVLALKSLPELEEALGSAADAVADLKQLFSLAEQYGYSQWIQFDASIVRGLSYYTGVVFEGFDREGKLRAICGGGRYDQLLSTFGGTDTPACGFGFGDAVIVELLKDKGLLPDLSPEVDDIVFPIDQQLQGSASMITSRLRQKGRSVDLVLEQKRLKWIFKHAERIKASRLILVGKTEWERGMVRVKNLSTREEQDVKVDELN
ncbi:histidine--tRNA ligase, chloroplastic/mitochondrial isoform X3 [Aristolochia californica]|uniref:histidine--tRNA ligase, chloroplastic/mitochondrial isoform X3 n=1 Tax=Aristolochia californica TaxID=171875 RepID=UPI0035D84837